MNICRFFNETISTYLKVHAFERFIFKFLFYGSFNAVFREDFRHGNNSSVTSKSPLLPKFENILLLSDKSKIFSNFGNNGDFDVTEQLKTAPV